MKSLREMMDMIDSKDLLPQEFTQEELEIIHRMGDQGEASSAIAHRIGNCTVADIDALLDRKYEYDDEDEYYDNDEDEF